MMSSCRVCGSSAMVPVLSLGEQPLANHLLTAPDLSDEEDLYPLDLLYCESCTLVQLGASVPPSDLFDEYAYFSSQSQTMIRSGQTLAERLTRDPSVEDWFVVEVASNDGYLLQQYRSNGIAVLGVDPAANVVQVARERGVPTLCEYFSEDIGRRIATDYRPANIIHANNVIAHVPDPVDLLKGIGALLREDGLAVIEFPWVARLIDRTAFDTIYHEHLFYYSLTSFQNAVRAAGLYCTDVEEIDLHGGSLRVFLRRQQEEEVPNLRRVLEYERERGLTSLSGYQLLQQKVHSSIELLENEIDSIVGDGGTVAGYGAAAKATVLLNAAPRAADAVTFVVDSTPYKQGRFLPGVRIPIYPPEHLMMAMPTHTLILAWNFADEIMSKESEYIERGGRFFVPLPEPQYVTRGESR